MVNSQKAIKFNIFLLPRQEGIAFICTHYSCQTIDKYFVILIHWQILAEFILQMNTPEREVIHWEVDISECTEADKKFMAMAEMRFCQIGGGIIQQATESALKCNRLCKKWFTLHGWFQLNL